MTTSDETPDTVEHPDTADQQTLDQHASQEPSQDVPTKASASKPGTPEQRPTKSRSKPDLTQRKLHYILSLYNQYRPINSLEIAATANKSMVLESEALAQHTQTNHILINPSQCQDFNQFSTKTASSEDGASEQELDYDDLISRLTDFKATPPPSYDTPADTASPASTDAAADNIEYITAKSAEVLPELIFQGQQVEMALIAGWRTFDYAFADFFYIDKLLSNGGILIIDNADKPSTRKLCHFIVSNLPYQFVSNLEQKDRRPLIEQIVTRHLHRLPFVSSKVRQLIRPEVLDTQYAERLDSPILTLQKSGSDQRSARYHEAF